MLFRKWNASKELLSVLPKRSDRWVGDPEVSSARHISRPAASSSPHPDQEVSGQRRHCHVVSHLYVGRCLSAVSEKTVILILWFKTNTPFVILYSFCLFFQQRGSSHLVRHRRSSLWDPEDVDKKPKDWKIRLVTPGFLLSSASAGFLVTLTVSAFLLSSMFALRTWRQLKDLWIIISGIHKQLCLYIPWDLKTAECLLKQRNNWSICQKKSKERKVKERKYLTLVIFVLEENVFFIGVMDVTCLGGSYCNIYCFKVNLHLSELSVLFCNLCDVWGLMFLCKRRVCF